VLAKAIESAEELELRLSEPSDVDRAFIRDLKGDILILGAGGKVGPSLAKLAKRSAEEAAVKKRVIAVSRFTSSAAQRDLQAAGIETIACDLLDPMEVRRLPRCENVLYLAGRKFGSSGRPDLTWAANAVAPVLAVQHYQDSRIVVFSTGNVYSFTDVGSGGSRETDAPAPVGEYAQSCLGRERIFEYFSNEHKTPCLLFRLNYATDLRYGVLVDIARKVYLGQPMDVSVPAINTLWQRDANSYALRSLDLCASPARVLNVTGAETIMVSEAAAFFAARFRKKLQLCGGDGKSALLSNASECHALLGSPTVDYSTLREWTADWVSAGHENLGKPTHFEALDGKY
jgi:hypothetical protein